jgi:phage terminase small subunit
MSLTAKQTLFVREYLIDFNGAQAAIRAGYSEKTARTIASENLKKPAIAAEIARGKARLMKRLSREALDMAREAAQVAYASLADIRGADGKFLPIEEWPPEFVAAVQYVRFSKSSGSKAGPGRVIKVKMQDKMKALRFLGKQAGLI